MNTKCMFLASFLLLICGTGTTATAAMVAEPLPITGPHLSLKHRHKKLLRQQSISSVNFEFPTLVEWTAHCLRSCDEVFAGIQYASTPCLSSIEFEKAIDLFLQKFKDKGIFDQWVGLELPSATTSPDFKYPYVSKLNLENESIACFIGDLHGSVHSLLRSLWRLVALGYLDKNFKIIKKHFCLVFLGDYTDRGRYGTEVFYTLLRVKCANWGKCYLVRGNHEVKPMNERPSHEGGGFWQELATKYPGQTAINLFSKICDIYQRLALAVYLTANNQTIKAVHGGFGPYEYYYDDQMKKLMEQDLKRYRHVPLQDTDLISPAFQWCDISQQVHAGPTNNFVSDTGRVWRIDIPTLVARLEQSNLKALFRGHQHGSFGLKMLFPPEVFATLSDKKTGHDAASSHYHWFRVVSTLYPDDVIENNTSGFKVSKYVPLFTFSSAPEGIGNHDCFGLLFMNDLFEDWRLKVYEFESPVTQVENQESVTDKPFYTVLRPADPQKPNYGTAEITDPIKASFFLRPWPPLAEEELTELLNRIQPTE